MPKTIQIKIIIIVNIEKSISLICLVRVSNLVPLKNLVVAPIFLNN